MPFVSRPAPIHPQTFGERLAVCRQHRGVSISALARAVGVHRNQLAAYEADRVSPQLTTVQALAGALQVTVGHLVGEVPLPCLCQAIPALE